MARTNSLENFLTDVSSAIKQKTGDNTPIPAEDFDTEILAIPAQGTYQEKSLTVNQNGNVTLLPDTGYDALSRVSITTNVTDPEYATNLLLSEQILGSVIPYKELEYIQSTGTQYLITDLTFKNTYKLEAKFAFADSSDLSGDPFGTRTYNGTNTLNNMFLSTYYDCWFAWGTNETSVANTRLGTNLWELIVDKNKWYLNGTLKATFTDSVFTSGTMYLFAEHYYNTKPGSEQDKVSYKSKTKIYYFRLYDENNTMLADFIPVKRKSDNEICMYDRVARTFFTNQGTGTFIAGPEVV